MKWWNALVDYIAEVLQHLTDLGPIGAILMTFIEAFFPPLPLVVFVTVNVAAFGFIQGYIYSVIGTIAGNILVFFLIKRFGNKRIQRVIQKRPRLKNLLIWIKDKGFGPVFILYTFPFSPSILVCGLAAFSDMKNRDYIWSAVLGKLVMVLSLSFIGYNVKSFLEQPIKSGLFILGTVALSYVGKYIIGRHEKHLEKKHGHLSVDDVISKEKK